MTVDSPFFWQIRAKNDVQFGRVQRSVTNLNRVWNFFRDTPQKQTLKINMKLFSSRLRVVALLLTINLAFAASASADLVLNFSTDGGATFSNDFEVVTGSDLLIEVYLVDTDGAGGILDTQGLFSLDLLGELMATDFGTITGAGPDPVFDGIITDSFTDDTFEWQAAVQANLPPATETIALGTFRFETTDHGVSTFEFSDRETGTSGWATGSATILDEEIFGAGSANSFTLTVTSIPEPTSACVLLAGLAVTFARRRRSV